MREALRFADPDIECLRAPPLPDPQTVGGRFWLVYTVAGGKITRQEAFLTKEQALEAAGPPP